MYKISLLISLFVVSVHVQAQVVQGLVADQNHAPLIGATVLELGTGSGTLTDLDGKFKLNVSTDPAQLIISFAGFQIDTISAGLKEPAHVMLSAKITQLDEVMVASSSTFIDNVKPILNEVITEKELVKGACCNLSESFETNASVDVSFADAVTGTKVIRMLGLDGRYVQINRENMPHVRGLIGRNGMHLIPGTWIQSIDLGKGAGSVINGYESMAGQINVELKKPSSEKIYLNAYGNSFGRMEFNANYGTALNENWGTALLFHGDHFGNELDGNDDGFMDLPKSRHISALNRYEYRTGRVHSQIGMSMLYDERAGGQLGFDFGDHFRSVAQFGFTNKTNRVELFGKTGLIFPDKPFRGWGFIYSLNYTKIDGEIGRRAYEGRETSAYLNAIYQNIIGNSQHQYKMGSSILFDQFKEEFAGSVLNRREIVPGIFYEYSYLPNDNFSLVAGVRTDFHNLYGTFFTPRLHVRRKLSELLTVRAAIGRGYRVPNVIMENIQMLISSRQLLIQETPNPEISWNAGTSLVMTIPIGLRKLNLVGDYYYTTFENQLIYDMDADAYQLRVYNLDGESYAHSFQIEGSMNLTSQFSTKLAYKYYDVRTTIDGLLLQVPFTARDRVFFNLGYKTEYEKWHVDATFQWFGKKRLPHAPEHENHDVLQHEPYSDNFFLLNAQIAKNYRWGSVYMGSENLLDFTQNNPILDAENPFGRDFDASMVWAPVAGRMVYLGFRYKIKQR